MKNKELIDKEAIKCEVKQIMDNFIEALGKIDLAEKFVLKREKCFREEGEGKEKDDDFRQRFLENAPKVNSSGAIIANRGQWVK